VITGAEVAIALAAWAGIVALFALMRPVDGRHAMTMRLSLTLLRYDDGLALLSAEARRSETWWLDIDPATQHHIDRALSMWDLAAWYVATRRVDRRAVMDVFRWHIVNLWECAYPYVEHRRQEQPTMWASLTDLYLDAYNERPRTTVDVRRQRPTGADPRHLRERGSRSPEPATAHVEQPQPVVVERRAGAYSPLDVELLRPTRRTDAPPPAAPSTPAVAPAPPDAPRPEAAPEQHVVTEGDRAAALMAALREPAPTARRSAPLRARSAAPTARDRPRATSPSPGATPHHADTSATGAFEVVIDLRDLENRPTG
jgi:hypothetical protein